MARRLRAALEDLEAIAPAQRVAPLTEQLELLDAAVRRAFDDPPRASVMGEDVDQRDRESTSAVARAR